MGTPNGWKKWFLLPYRAAVVWQVCWRTAFKNSAARLMTVLYVTAEMSSGKRLKLEGDHSNNKPQGSEYLCFVWMFDEVYSRKLNKRNENKTAPLHLPSSLLFKQVQVCVCEMIVAQRVCFLILSQHEGDNSTPSSLLLVTNISMMVLIRSSYSLSSLQPNPILLLLFLFSPGQLQEQLQEDRASNIPPSLHSYVLFNLHVAPHSPLAACLNLSHFLL